MSSTPQDPAPGAGGTLVFWHPHCSEHDTGSGHPERAARMQAVLDALGAPEFRGLQWREAPAASFEQLERVHPAHHVDRLMSRAQEESSRVLADLTWADLPAVTLVRRTPLLVLGAENDALVPASEVLETARRYGAEAEIMARVAHVMMFEPGWDRVARRVAGWLARQGH